MATHSNILAWKIPLKVGPGGLTVHGAAKSQIQLNTHAQQPDVVLSILAYNWKISHLIFLCTNLLNILFCSVFLYGLWSSVSRV